MKRVSRFLFPVELRLQMSEAGLNPPGLYCFLIMVATLGLLVGLTHLRGGFQKEIRSNCYVQIGSQKVPVNCPN